MSVDTSASDDAPTTKDSVSKATNPVDSSGAGNDDKAGTDIDASSTNSSANTSSSSSSDTTSTTNKKGAITPITDEQAESAASSNSSSATKNDVTPTPVKKAVRKIGYDENNEIMPGFQAVHDDELAFSSESDFAIFIKQISSEIPLQRLVAVKRMMKSCKIWGGEAVLSVLPRVKQLSSDKEMVIRQAIAEVLGPFAKYLIECDDGEQVERAHVVIINELLPLIKEMLKDATEVRQGAGQSLIVIAELLNKEQVYEHILKIVLHMAHDDSDDQKITALPLLGDLAPIVGSAVCKNYLSADLHALSQDNSFRVRKATVQYFGPICQQLSSSDCNECLLPIFLNLCGDTIWSVRKGCVESFVDVSSSISPSERVKLIPIMEKFLNDSSRWVRNTAYEILGPFISTLSSEQISKELLGYFTSIPHLSSAEADADCTNHCAFNFPAVCLTVGKERWPELNDTYNILCRKTFKSRKTLACSIHEIANVLGQDMTEKFLLSGIEFFLKDIDDIRCGIIHNLWKILKVFNHKLRVEYVNILWELASEADVNWRFRLLLSQQLDEMLHLYEPSVVREQLVPLMFQLCQDRMADVRYAAVYPIADAINVLQKSARNGENSEEISGEKEVETISGEMLKNSEKKPVPEKISEKVSGTEVTESTSGNTLGTEGLQSVLDKIQLIYKGRTYSKRLLYVRIAESCFGRIEQALFDVVFLKDLCAYATDRIFNVRFCVARLIAEKLLTDTERKVGYAEEECVQRAMKVLKEDDEDVEIKRFFMSEDEVESWLQYRKEQRRLMNERMQRSAGSGMSDDVNVLDDELDRLEEADGGLLDMDDGLEVDKGGEKEATDSAVYSSSDDGEVGGDDEDDDDSLDDEEDEDSLTDDNLKSVSDQLNQIDESLQHIQTESDDQEIELLKIQHEMEMETEKEKKSGLVHQDTPFVINISKELKEEIKEEEAKLQKVSSNYGLKAKEEEQEQDIEQEEEEQEEEAVPEEPKVEPEENPQEEPEAEQEQIEVDESAQDTEEVSKAEVVEEVAKDSVDDVEKEKEKVEEVVADE